MSAYNIVRAELACPSCKSEVSVRVQFKFADTWQHEYEVGDVLRWGGNDVGERALAHAVIDGVVEGSCPRCGYEGEWDVYLHVRNDRIDRVERADGRYNFAADGHTYIVLER